MELDSGLPGGSWANTMCGCCRSSSRLSRDLLARNAAKHREKHHHPGAQTAQTPPVHPKHLHGMAFGAVMLASSALNNLFVTYHLDFYLTVVGVSPAYFYLGHCVFMAWNATNDVVRSIRALHDVDAALVCAFVCTFARVGVCLAF